jgi:pyruvate/2-oxoglutarate dehydrogenase complex dihydrolipoamide acyltransferase (E2) component
MSTNEHGRTPIRIPQAGVSMTEGTIVDWMAAEGERVTVGQTLYSLETEKVELDVECPASGVLHIIGRPGQLYPVGEEIGFIDHQ